MATTLPFGRFVMDHPAFVSADFDTNFIKLYFTPELLLAENEAQALVAAKLALRLHYLEKRKLKVVETVSSAWINRSK